MEKAYDVVVVGAGMVGLACAVGLAKDGFRIAVLESQSGMASMPNQSDPVDNKVVAISRASLALFEKLEIEKRIMDCRVGPYEKMTVWDSVCDGLIEFSAHDVYEPNLGYIIEQRVIIGALWGALRSYSNVDVFFNAALKSIDTDDEDAYVNFSTEKIVAKLVIGADGANSTVRKIMAMSTREKDYNQSAVVATIKGTRSHGNTAYQRFASDGPLAWLPLFDPLLTSIVWTTTPLEAKRLCALPKEEFNTLLTRESEGKLGELDVISPRLCYPLKSHHARQYSMHRCVLVGDAAHTIHPLAGMGVNLGFLDCATLLKVLHEAKNKKRDFGRASWLTRYERERRWHNQMIMSSMDAFKEGFGSEQPLVQAMRNRAFNFVQRHRILKRFFVRQAFASAYT